MVGLQSDADHLRGPMLPRQIDFRRSVVSDQDGRELRLHASALHPLGLQREAGLDLRGDRLPVHDDRGHFLTITTFLPSIFSLPSRKSLTASGYMRCSWRKILAE